MECSQLRPQTAAGPSRPHLILVFVSIGKLARLLSLITNGGSRVVDFPEKSVSLLSRFLLLCITLAALRYFLISYRAITIFRQHRSY